MTLAVTADRTRVTCRRGATLRRNPTHRIGAARIGAHLTTWRKLYGLTAEQVADRAGTSRGTLRRLENGETTVGLDVFLNVARVLGSETVEAGIAYFTHRHNATSTSFGYHERGPDTGSPGTSAWSSWSRKPRTTTTQRCWSPPSVGTRDGTTHGPG